jgi:hypothetical protein
LDDDFEATKSATNRGDSLPRATALAFAARAGRGRVPRNLKRFASNGALLRPRASVEALWTWTRLWSCS